jgi:hypothetical protein
MANVLPPSVTWAADSGCFASPHEFDPLRYLGFLAKNQDAVDRCLFVTMPDVVADAAATLKRVQSWPIILRGLGFKPALVAQDGLESLEVPWDDLDALFIGGTTTWKLSHHAHALVVEANRRGKWTHMGRVNSLRRIRAAQLMGCRSVDGTFLLFGPDVNLPKMQRWLDELDRQPVLFTAW